MGVFIKVRDAFSNELTTNGDAFRILRKGTLVDLIILNFFHFQKDKNAKYLIEIFNASMKIKLISRLKEIELGNSLEDSLNKFNQEPENILKQYDIIFNELFQAFGSSKELNNYTLNEKIQYIKVINGLEIDSYSDSIFEEIIGITYNLLEKELN